LPLRGNYLCDNKLADRFRSIRTKTGLSQKDFAETLGVSQSAIAEIERGSREPSRNIMVALAGTYHISLDWLLLGAELSHMTSPISKEEDKDVEIENLKKKLLNWKIRFNNWKLKIKKLLKRFLIV
jgi:transcriptional regulator with XRE-family HTH domain